MKAKTHHRAAKQAKRRGAQPQAKPLPESVTVVFQKPSGRELCRVEFHRELFDLVMTVCRKRHWGLYRFFHAAVDEFASKLEADQEAS